MTSSSGYSPGQPAMQRKAARIRTHEPLNLAALRRKNPGSQARRQHRPAGVGDTPGARAGSCEATWYSRQRFFDAQAMAKQAKAPEVYKFGGASLGDGAAFQARRQPSSKSCETPLVVVCSAPAGVTDLLLEVAEKARHGDEAKVAVAVQTLRDKYAAILRALRLPTRAGAASWPTRSRRPCASWRPLASGLAVLRELTPRTSDLVVSRGERLGTRLFVAALAQAGVKAEYVDALEVVVTRGPFGGAAPDLEATDASGPQAAAAAAGRGGDRRWCPGFLGLYQPAARRAAGAGHAGPRRHRPDRHPDGAGPGRQPGLPVEGRPGPAHRRPAGGARRPRDPAAERARGGRAGLLRGQGAAPAGAHPAGRPRHPAVPAARSPSPSQPGTEISARHTLDEYPVKALSAIAGPGAGHGGGPGPDRRARRGRRGPSPPCRSTACRSR